VIPWKPKPGITALERKSNNPTNQPTVSLDLEVTSYRNESHQSVRIGAQEIRLLWETLPATNSEDTADWEDLLGDIVNCRVQDAPECLLCVVTSCMNPINPVTNPDTCLVSSH
jgi:hypothetical protein